MHSVAKQRPKVKAGVRWFITDKSDRQYTLMRGDLGLHVKRGPGNGLVPKNHPTVLRKAGDITTFSEHSRARLRVTLATAFWRRGGDVRRLGLTLTLPWAATPDEWRTVWHDFVVRFARHCQASSLVWRIELTTGESDKSDGLRRAHVHAVSWLPVDRPLDPAFASCWSSMDRDVRSSMNARTVAETWIKTWSRRTPALTISQLNYATSVGFGRGHGVVLRWLDDTPHGAIHYLCDHATKHKAAQLGWIGRQWGVVNRSNLGWAKDGDKLDGATWVLVQRHLRRLNDSRFRDARRLVRDGSTPLAARSLAGYFVPVGDNKTWFGSTRRTLEQVIKAALDGRIARVDYNVPRGTKC